MPCVRTRHFRWKTCFALSGPGERRGVEADMVAAVQAGVTNTVALNAGAPYFTYANLLSAWSSIDAAYRVGPGACGYSARQRWCNCAALSILPDAPCSWTHHIEPTSTVRGTRECRSAIGLSVFEESGVDGPRAGYGSAVVGAFLNVPKVLPVRFGGAEIVNLPTRFADYGQMSWSGFRFWSASTSR